MTKEFTEWRPITNRRGPGKRLESVQALSEIQPGETVRIRHFDAPCNTKTGRCYLNNVLADLRKLGWVIEIYHEAPHILVAHRSKDRKVDKLVALQDLRATRRRYQHKYLKKIRRVEMQRKERYEE